METRTEPKYGLVKTVETLPKKDLLAVPHRNGRLVVGHPAFGPNYFRNNIAEMKKRYSHISESYDLGSGISFGEPTTSESVSAAHFGFGNDGEVDTKRDIFDPRWLQAGWVLRGRNGVYANPVLDAQGNPITNEDQLQERLQGISETDGAYFGENDFGFAPYESFTRGKQDCDTFASGGLARVLEHSGGKVAPKLRDIASLRHYKSGVYVGFDPVKGPILAVASLGSYGYLDDRRLDVYGGWDDGRVGHAFGVFSREAGAPKN
jgi:hypothetical protein